MINSGKDQITTTKQQHSVLITGGAGYIGSHLTLLLRKQGYQVIVIDNLSTGNAWSVPEDCLITGDILDTDTLINIMREQQFQTVVHLAAKSSVPESFDKPDDYFENNVNGTKSVIEACASAGIQQLLFSSTAAVYGNATHGIVKENAPLNPISPYGKSKLEAEQVVKILCALYGIKQITFRYFNVIGAHPKALIGQYNPGSGHLLQKCLDCVQKSTPLQIYGNDYDTVDGTAERDYIHVQDLASLHLHAMRYLDRDGKSQLLNAGYGTSHSVLEFIQTFQKIANKTISSRYVSRREGDPISLIADPSRLDALLDWQPQFSSLEQMIGSSWLWEISAKRRSIA